MINRIYDSQKMNSLRMRTENQFSIMLFHWFYLLGNNYHPTGSVLNLEFFRLHGQYTIVLTPIRL